MSNEEVAEGLVAMLQTMSDAASANEGKCDATANAMQAILDDNRDLIAAAKRFDSDPEAQKWFEQTYQARIEPLLGPFIQAMQACQDNPTLQRVFESI